MGRGLGDVYPGGPGAGAGLQIGDVVVSVDGKAIENGRQFDVTIYRQPIGQSVALDVRRGLKRQTVRVPVVERQDDAAVLRDLVTPERNLIPRLGVLGLDVTEDLAPRIPGLREPRGVVVAALTPDATTGPEGLQTGDVIYGLNGADVLAIADLRQGLASVAAGESVVLQVGRQGRLRFVAVTVE